MSALRIQIKIKIVAAILASCLATDAKSTLACTTFSFWSAGTLYTAHSFDFDGITAGHLFLNPAGLKKKAFTKRMNRSDLLGTPLNWRSSYASFSFSPVGADFPISGMNERGLIVSILEQQDLAGEESPNSRPYINEVQFVQYLLDTSANLESAIENAGRVRITNSLIMGHYYLCSPQGCATLEYGPAGLKVTRRLPLMALENKTLAGSQRQMKAPGDNSRFKRAVELAKNFVPGTHAPIDYAFHGLETLRMQNTKWHILYAIDAAGIPQILFRRADLNSSPVFRAEMNFVTWRNAKQPASVNLYGFDPQKNEAIAEAFNLARADELLAASTTLIQPIQDLLITYASERLAKISSSPKDCRLRIKLIRNK